MKIRELIEYLEKEEDDTLEIVVCNYDHREERYHYDSFNQFTICKEFVPDNGKPRKLIINLL